MRLPRDRFSYRERRGMRRRDGSVHESSSARPKQCELCLRQSAAPQESRGESFFPIDNLGKIGFAVDAGADIMRVSGIFCNPGAFDSAPVD